MGLIAAVVLMAIGLWAVFRTAKEERLQRDWDRTPAAMKKRQWELK